MKETEYDNIEQPQGWDERLKWLTEKFDEIEIPTPIDRNPDDLTLDYLELVMMENDRLFIELGSLYGKAYKLKIIAERWYDIMKEDGLLEANQDEKLKSEKVRNAYAEKKARPFKERFDSAKTIHELIRIERSNLYKQSKTHAELSNIIKKTRYQ